MIGYINKKDVIKNNYLVKHSDRKTETKEGKIR